MGPLHLQCSRRCWGRRPERSDEAPAWKAFQELVLLAVPRLLKHFQASVILSPGICCQLGPYQQPSYPLQKCPSSPRPVHVASSELFLRIRPRCPFSHGPPSKQLKMHLPIKESSDASFAMILNTIMIRHAAYFRKALFLLPPQNILCFKDSFCFSSLCERDKRETKA